MGSDPNDAENSAANVNGPGDTITELWNLVFLQFDRTGQDQRHEDPGGRVWYDSYRLEPLPAPSVDTGMGLERLAVVLQGKFSNYDTDLIRPIIDYVSQLAEYAYGGEEIFDFAMRVIADHARAAAFLIADGILPGNTWRNYVLRKIMRRAIYHGKQRLGIEDLFFYKVTDFVVDLMRDAYPELEAQRDFIRKMVKLEEQRFVSTLSLGLQKLKELVEPSWPYVPEIKELAKLYDTFGLPRDLIRVNLEEHVNRKGHIQGGTNPFLPDYVVQKEDGRNDIEEDKFNESFDAALEELQQTGATNKAEGKTKTRPVYVSIATRSERSEFKGYETTRVADARVVSLIKSGNEVQDLIEGAEGEVVLDRTPFYAESGGQVGDVGRLMNPPFGTGGGELAAAIRAHLAAPDFMASVIDT